jgi:hypothetical protein
MIRALSLLLLAGALAAQEPAEQTLPLRVSAMGPGAAVSIDRGARDGVARGDRVVFRPLEGGEVRGTVVQVDERSALVELLDRTFVPVTGTRGEVTLARRAPTPVPVPVPAPDKPQWQNPDNEFTRDQPLLAQVRPVRPEQRELRISGRTWALGELAHSTDDGFASSLLRGGFALLAENPFGRGGELHADAELDYKTETNDQVGADARVRRLSYIEGGTRFSRTRWEAGRFLQHGMPEFGVLDGFEWTARRADGQRYGASIGFLPELDDDFDSLEDFQVAAHWLWVDGPREQLTAGIGLQKTLHNGHGDRDLIVGKLRWLPADGWDLNGTAWVDLYYGRDDVKGNGLEVTQALASLARRFESGDGFELSYRRLRFPELLRNGEFIPVLPGELADNRHDRLAFDAWTNASERTRLHGNVSGWSDEEDDRGGAAELGFDVQEPWLERSRGDLTAFATLGRFATVLGGRLSYGRFTENGRWDVYYELAHHHLRRYADDADDLFQHRLGAIRSFSVSGGFDVSLHADVHLWDEELAWTIGFQVHKSF